MSTLRELAQALVDTCLAAMPDIDRSDTAGYVPAIETERIALIASALGHADEGYVYSQGWMHTVHRFRLEFWVKLDVANIADCIDAARGIGYRAMQALTAADGVGGYTLSAAGMGPVFTGSVDPTPLDPANTGIPYLRYVLYVPVMQKETV